MATINGLPVCGWAGCQACGGKPARQRKDRVASEAARKALVHWPGWRSLNCVERRTLALAFDKFSAAQKRKGAKS